MDDAPAGRDSPEVVKTLLTPLQELVALEIAFVFNLKIALARVWEQSGDVDLDRVIYDQIDRHLRVYSLWIASHLHHSIPQCSDVDYCRHSCEILQNDSAGTEGDLCGSHLRGPCGYP